MNPRPIVLLAALAWMLATAASGAQTRPATDTAATVNRTEVEFPAADGITVTADLYRLGGMETAAAPCIVLFHQAGWSRGEYREIAPKLCRLGFQCLAVDQRSGGKVKGVENATARRATEAMLPGNYLDAVPDLHAAIGYARPMTSGPVIGWGSSYSASLVLRLAGDHPKALDGVLAFAPGEYFERFGRTPDYVTSGARHIVVPTFITSARGEAPRWSGIFDAVGAARVEAGEAPVAKLRYIPTTAGQHGSRRLWEEFPDHAGYWDAVTGFLETHFLSKATDVDPATSRPATPGHHHAHGGGTTICVCAEAKRTNGWCTACGVGYVAGRVVTSADLHEAIDAHGHRFNGGSIRCESCQRAIRNNGYCEKCGRGFLDGQLYFSELTYVLAQGEFVSEVSCPKGNDHRDWCGTCGEGLVGNRVFRDPVIHAWAAGQYARLETAVTKSKECELCAIGFLLGTPCPRCVEEPKAN